MATTAKLVEVLAATLTDANGDPLNGYQVRTYASDGSTPAAVWEDRAKSLPDGAGKSQFTLSTTGYAEVYGDNTYVIKIWTATATPGVDDPYLSIGPVGYSFDNAGDITGDLTGDVLAADGTKVLENGTDGNDSTYTGDVTGDVTGDLTGDVTGDLTGNSAGTHTGAVVGDVTGDLTGGIVETGASIVINVKVIDIGDWNMDTTQSVNVAHGVTSTKIRAVSALIRNDGGNITYDIYYDPDVASPGTGIRGVQFDSTDIILRRATGGQFDNASFDLTTYNRGWITIWYTD